MDTERRLYNDLHTMKPTTLYEQFKRMDIQETHPAKADAEGKQVVTKEEAQRLRDSVLKANRPLNPYFDSSSSPSLRSSPPTPNKSPTNHHITKTPMVR
jgi:hypothetical protein